MKILHAFTRWMYRGRRPNWLARIMNRASAVAASSGLTSNLMETLEVTGRKSGRTFSLPVVIAIVDGERYLAWRRSRAESVASEIALRGGGHRRDRVDDVAPLFLGFRKIGLW